MSQMQANLGHLSRNPTPIVERTSFKPSAQKKAEAIDILY